MSAYWYHLEIGHDRFLPHSFQHILLPAIVKFCVEIWMQACKTRNWGELLEENRIIIYNNFVRITGVVLYKSPMCLSLHLSTSTTFVTAYLICVFADQVAHFCLSCRVVLVFFFVQPITDFKLASPFDFIITGKSIRRLQGYIAIMLLCL